MALIKGLLLAVLLVAQLKVKYVILFSVKLLFVINLL